MRILLLFIGLSSSVLSAQQLNLDSLWGVWNDTEQKDTSRLNAIQKIIWKKYLFSQPDSAFYFAQLQYDFAVRNNEKKFIASALNMQGITLGMKGRFNKAINYYNQSIRINEEINNKERVAKTLNNIGLIYQELGEHEKANDSYMRSLKTLKEIGDKKVIAIVLNNIGNNYFKQGNYHKAMDFYTQSLKLKEEIDDKVGIAITLGNIGLIYDDQGDYAKAMDFYLRALKINQEIGNRNIAFALNNIGTLYGYQGNYDKAIDYFNRSLKVAEENGKINVITTVLINIGNYYSNQNDYDTASYYFQRALKINQENNYKKGVSSALYSIGMNYRNQGDYEKAIQYRLRSLSIAQEIGEFKNTKYICRTLLDMYNEFDSLQQANSMANLLKDLRLRDLRLNLNTLSEQQKEMYFATMSSDFDLLYDFSMHNPSLTSWADNSFNITLLTKGLLLKSSTVMRNTILNSKDSSLTEQYYEWLSFKRIIVKAYTQGADVSKLEEKTNELEKELVKGSQEFSDFKKIQEINWKDVQSGLHKGEVAVEFIRFLHQDDYRNDSNKVQLYAALVIDSKCPHPKMIRLFEESLLEEILGTFPGNNLSYIEQVYGTQENVNTQLYDLIWKPMEGALFDAKKVYISPVGLLHKISFAALAKEKDVYLCDLYDIEMKSSTGKIITEDPNNFMLDDNASTTIFGGIEYTRDKNEKEVWAYLEGTKTETQKIHKTIGNKLGDINYYSGFNASEEVFKEEAPTSNILHIATHGFFYIDPNEIEDKIETNRIDDSVLVFRGGSSGLGYEAFVLNHNPLMRSGIVFAGSNDVWSKSDQEGEDGVLTAAEVITLDLRNTDLVVLSACETGLGDIKGSEGVYGLQRSFKMAGVKYLIMSLWQVPDKETADFMTIFYKYLTKTKNIKSSFNQAQKDMRKKYDPYYWAAFVLIE